MIPKDIVALHKRFEYELLSCNTKEEAKLYAKEFILDIVKEYTFDEIRQKVALQGD